MKKILKKFLGIITITAYSVSSIVIPIPIGANDSPVLQINNVTGKDGDNYVTFYDGDNLSGKLCIRTTNDGPCLEPTIDNDAHTATFNFVTNDNVQIGVFPAEGYLIDEGQYSLGGVQISVPGDNIIGVNELTNDVYNFDITFLADVPQHIDNTLITVHKPAGTTVEIDPEDQGKLIYKKNGITVGSAKLKSGIYYNPTLNEGNATFDVPDYNNSNYIAYLEVYPEPGTSLDMFYHVDGAEYSVPMNNQLAITINNNREYEINFDFAEGANSAAYPLVAYFEGIAEGQDIIDDVVTIPEGFTTGNIVFKAKVCDANNGNVVPDDGSIPCTNNREIAVRNEGIINGTQINNTVTPITGGVKIKNGFEHFGKVSVHITKALLSDPEINTHINVITEDLIDVEAMSPLEMSYSLGSASTNHAILTNDNTDDIAVFFGNTGTMLYATGVNVDRITHVSGTYKNATINPDGSVEIEFPELTKETSTKVNLTILMNDGRSINKTVNLVRTAILLQHNYGGSDDSVYAGYVVNKSYLYNNHDHNDTIFNAYLQVMLYKDNVVVGYKQIKIADESLINHLHENESGSLELYSEHQIPVYGKATNDLIDGVNKVSVFLTDGPVDFNKTLPSIEFGIGSGVTLEWEAK